MQQAKESEVHNLAAKYGVDNYIGTSRFDAIQQEIEAWSNSTENLNGLQRESHWIDSKRRIENLMRNMSLDSNSSQSLWLLGQAGNAVPYGDVRTAFLDGWERLLKHNATTLSELSKADLDELDTWRDSQLTKIPEHGLIGEKQALIDQMKGALSDLSNQLTKAGTGVRRSSARAGLGQRETTRSILLAQAQSDLKAGNITKAEFNEVNTLIGTSNSLFQGQLRTIGQWGNDLSPLYEQMDRTLTAARGVLRRSEGRENLSGSFFGITARQRALGMIDNATKSGHNGRGDGLRIYDARPTVRGQMPTMMKSVGAYHEGGQGQPWVGVPQHYNQPESPWANLQDPRNDHRYAADPMLEPSSRPGSPYQQGAKPGLFGKTVRKLRGHRMAGIQTNGNLGGPVVNADEHPVVSSLMWVAMAGVTIYGVVKLVGNPTQRADASRTRAETKRLDSGIGGLSNI